MAITLETGPVPPAVVLLQRIESSRILVPLIARPVVSPLLDAFAAYVAATEQRLRNLEGPVQGPVLAHGATYTRNRCNGG